MFEGALGFFVTLIGVFLMGYMQMSGELTALKYSTTHFEPLVLGSFGFGTGMSGVIGPMVYIFLNDPTVGLGMTRQQICLVLVWKIIPLYLCFAVLVAE